MIDIELKIESVMVDDLVPYAGNAKEHPAEQIEQIMHSMRIFGNCDPIGVWENEAGALEIVEGHGRVMALKRLGVEYAPVIRLDHLTDEQRREYVHVHNQTTMNSDFDEVALAAEMEALPDFDWDAFWFDVSSAEEDQPKEEAPEIPFAEVLGEENNYVVLKFDNDVDWLNALTVFGLENKRNLSTRKDGHLTKSMTRVGLGRVIDGAKAINALLGGDPS